ncbi:hypothetical protein E3U55_14575 [Filobacillus milosensis]|uniref:Uncharacterized protein n=1 Tax=Filobacillus milosensis TaxID=94137 RepID=A0A4Y8IGR8_9BACI|nr:hypothetical protein E3U55_14575 [Filobacillus milosensis]
MLLIGCDLTTNHSKEPNKLGELYVTTITDASDWSTKPKFLAITRSSFDEVDETTKEWVLAKLNNEYENVHILEEVKDDEDKFEFKKIRGKEVIVKVNNGMIIDVEIEQYSESEARVRVAAKRGINVGIIPEYEAVYNDGEWQLDKKVQAEI